MKISMAWQINGCFFLILILTSLNTHTQSLSFFLCVPLLLWWSITIFFTIFKLSSWLYFEWLQLWDNAQSHSSCPSQFLNPDTCHQISCWFGDLCSHDDLTMHNLLFLCFLWVKQCPHLVLWSLLKRRECKEFICTNSSWLERKNRKQFLF